MSNKIVLQQLAALVGQEDPISQALIATLQERMERRKEIDRLDGELMQQKQELGALRNQLLSQQEAKNELQRQFQALTMSKETVNVYDLEQLLNESWHKDPEGYKKVGTELRRIRIDLGLTEIPKDPKDAIPGLPRNRQPREHHKAVAVEFCRKYGYRVPNILL